MKNLLRKNYSKGIYQFPKVSLDVETGNCEITGESFMEDGKEFYGDIIKWLEEFHKTHKDKTLTIDFRLIYFNTSSTKMLTLMLKLTEVFRKGGQKVIINWYHDSDELELEEDILDLCSDMNIDVNIIST